MLYALYNIYVQVSNYYEVLISKYAFYCYYITFYNLELSTFCNNLISLIVSYFNKIGVFHVQENIITQLRKISVKNNVLTLDLSKS